MAAYSTEPTHVIVCVLPCQNRTRRQIYRITLCGWLHTLPEPQSVAGNIHYRNHTLWLTTYTTGTAICGWLHTLPELHSVAGNIHYRNQILWLATYTYPHCGRLHTLPELHSVASYIHYRDQILWLATYTIVSALWQATYTTGTALCGWLHTLPDPQYPVMMDYSCR